jgi:hypothetical protein
MGKPRSAWSAWWGRPGSGWSGPPGLILLLVLLCPLAGARGSAPPNPGDPGPTNVLLNTWSFADTTNWLSDLDHPPLSFTNLAASDLGAGLALVVDHPASAWLRYNTTENDGTTNLTVDNGSVMFWFAPHWAGTNVGGTGPGHWGRLIEVGAYTEDASFGWWSLHVDPAGVNLCFSAQDADGCQTNYLCVPITWTTNRWHLIALTYSTATNCSLYLDGDWVTNGPPMTCWPGPDVLAAGFCIGSDSNGLTQARGMFDSLVTYANPLDAGTIARTYRWQSVPYYLNPLNKANLSSAPFYTTNSPNFRAVMGPGFLQYLGPVNNCVTNNHVWTTNATASPLTNETTSLTFTVIGGSLELWYDVFGTVSLAGNSPADAQWAWLGQVSSCSRYSLTNLPGDTACLILGAPNDNDKDGLTDAYELLVSKTDPNDPDTDGDSIPDWWSVVYLRAQPSHSVMEI